MRRGAVWANPVIDQHEADLSHGAEPKREVPRCGNPKHGGGEANGQGRIAHAIKSSESALSDPAGSDSLPTRPKRGDTGD